MQSTQIPMAPSHSITPEHRFFGSRGAALNCIFAALKDANEIRIATAYFEPSGYHELQPVLRGKRVRLLIGRGEGGENNLKEVLDEFKDAISTGSLNGRTSAMRQMLEALELGLLMVSVGAEVAGHESFLDARYLYHHAKLYIADDIAAVVTSANLSHHGLCTSREAGITVTNLDDVAFFVNRFDHYFEQARSLTKDLIDALKKWLAEYDPYIIYARALLALYDLPQDDVPPLLPSLAKYQEGVVSSVLRSLMEHDGAFLIASTGLGKTIIAAHVAAYLRMQGEIDNVLVICPAGLREVWRRSIRSARVTSVEFSYHTLTRKDGDSQLPILEHELRQATAQTLVILDESHRLRNEESNGGDLRLSNERIKKTVRSKGAKVLLLTATPYGKDFSEVTSQLNLLPAPKQAIQTQLGMAVESTVWQAEQLAELPELPVCTVLTTPDVVRHFGMQDEAGERFVIFSPTDRRYFPRRIRLQTVRYTNPFDEFLADLLESKLLYKKVESINKSIQTILPMIIPDAEGERLALQEALFLHQFCSSPAEVSDVCNQLEQGGYSYDFARQGELSQFINKHRNLVRQAQKPRKDEKLNTLADIIRQAGNDKAVVFCEYHETARYIRDGLKILIRGIRVETTVEATDLDNLLRRFAPIANDVLPEERNPKEELQVLIATRSMAEGFNLQDASILVNYDLPWTVLQLAQRMGRILRPWSHPRDVVIYNFVPSTMGHERIRHARNWEKRLYERSRQHRSLAQIPVMVHKESRKAELEQQYEMEKLGREIFLASDDTAELDLEQVMEFIQSVDDLTTSTFYNDLATIRDRDEILKKPDGIKSAMVKTGKKRLFLLLRRGRSHIDTILADIHGYTLEESNRRDDVMRIIRCLPETPKAPPDLYPADNDFDSWIERTRRNWAAKHGLDPEKCQVICALALVPNTSQVEKN
jgi:superfamily II DNA or RNA helicase